MMRGSVRCRCCGCWTLTAPEAFEICPVCGWEDDPVQADGPDLEGGANRVSLSRAIASYAATGIADPSRTDTRDVRAPREDERGTPSQIGSCRLIDDDGVLLVGSEIGLRHWANPPLPFDYMFPLELERDMSAGRAVGWHADQEGEAMVSIEIDVEPDGADARWRGPGRLQLEEGSALVAMPYSQYTMACAERGGQIEHIDGLAAWFACPAGEYGVWVRPGDAAGEWIVRLVRDDRVDDHDASVGDSRVLTFGS